MDGLPQFHSVVAAAPYRQRTLKTAISCVGTGLHSGAHVQAKLFPAPEGHGIVFRREDAGTEIPARFDQVSDCRLATTISASDDPAHRIGTIEHLMAAFAACEIDNALVEVDGPELPILDGSAAPWLFLLDCAGIAEQEAPRRILEVVRPVRVGDQASWAELAPAGQYPGLDLSVVIEFRAAAIGTQALSLRLNTESFRRELARARTFALAEDVAALRSAGLARGGSLANAVVVDGANVLNPGGLRMDNEFARHKLLDAVGDLALAGAPLRARFRAYRSGHGLHNRLLQELFADPANWRDAQTFEMTQAAA